MVFYMVQFYTKWVSRHHVGGGVDIIAYINSILYWHMLYRMGGISISLNQKKVLKTRHQKQDSTLYCNITNARFHKCTK